MPTIVVKIFEGRSNETKREYAKALTEASTRVLGCDAGAVDVIFEEVKKSDWATGGVLWSERD
ncbi:4-oxalocrotonate tautomerase [Pseudomonas sp. MIL19]|uniref:4-oxalocrotonate tautomerase n=1 Tax=Pseudomonas sp. MIL19 TaxID=2976979 RepID=UPI002364828C|nr:4-oxalocrotonate tautomerase [Pseudomonas sp. MIL19]MBU0903496.1 4-oxalocrotonate tautomerase [Gammaproteobacteria bacterium]MDD2161734.1 4-oxalocrotonate tautomerase [Pseudomonas sp. MIL19]